jgi:hypothetical protein
LDSCRGTFFLSLVMPRRRLSCLPQLLSHCPTEGPCSGKNIGRLCRKRTGRRLAHGDLIGGAVKNIQLIVPRVSGRAYTRIYPCLPSSTCGSGGLNTGLPGHVPGYPGTTVQVRFTWAHLDLSAHSRAGLAVLAWHVAFRLVWMWGWSVDLVAGAEAVLHPMHRDVSDRPETNKATKSAGAGLHWLLRFGGGAMLTMRPPCMVKDASHQISNILAVVGPHWPGQGGFGLSYSATQARLDFNYSVPRSHARLSISISVLQVPD